MLISIFAGLSAISISIVAAYYSIVGLTAIFPATFLSIIIMGSVLEIGKIATTIWLHSFWNHASSFMKLYLSIAVIILMTITSLGIFGYLSKSHLENNSSTYELTYSLEEVNSKLERIDKEIKDSNDLKDQLDSVITTLTDAQRIRGKDGAIAVRESQKEERDRIASTISSLSDSRQELIKEKLSIQSGISKLEVEVGPIRYVAEMIYGENPDSSVLEKSVRYLIILIVVVFDPLALALLIAAITGMSITKKKPEPPIVTEEPEPEVPVVEEPFQEPTEEPTSEDIIQEPVEEPIIPSEPIDTPQEPISQEEISPETEEKPKSEQKVNGSWLEHSGK